MKLRKPQVVYNGTFRRGLSAVQRRRAATYLKKARYGVAPDSEELRQWDAGKATGRLQTATERELRKRALFTRYVPGKEVRFLDAGAGLGVGVIEAERISPNVRAYGLSLNPPNSRKIEKGLNLYQESLKRLKGKWFTTHFEKSVIPNYFDVIQAPSGLYYALNHAIALENLLNSLRKNGVVILNRLDLYNDPLLGNALVEKDRLNEHQKANLERQLELEQWQQGRPQLAVKRMLETLEKQGFQVTHPILKECEDIKPEEYCITNEQIRIIRKTRKKADLSDFYSHPAINRFPIT